MDQVRNFKGCPENKRTVRDFVRDDDRFIVADTDRFKYDIEVRLDFDDQVSEVFVHNLVTQYNTMKGDNAIVSYQPLIVDCNTGDMYRHPSVYSKDCPSMCMALIQKKEKRYGVYDRPHNLMQQETGYPVIVIPEAYYYLHVHGENTLSQLPDKKYKI